MSHHDLCACGKQAELNIPIPGKVLQIGRFCLDCAVESGHFCLEHMTPHALYKDGTSVCPCELKKTDGLIFCPSIMLKF